MYAGSKQRRGDKERCVTSARAAAKETNELPESHKSQTERSSVRMWVE